MIGHTTVGEKSISGQETMNSYYVLPGPSFYVPVRIKKVTADWVNEAIKPVFGTSPS
jgi:hypothetical protein